MDNENQNWERLVVGMLNKSMEKQDQLENVLHEIQKTDIQAYSRIGGQIESIEKDVSYLTGVVRDGNDSLITRLQDHESRIKTIETKELEEKAHSRDFVFWKRTAAVSICTTILNVLWNLASVFFIHKR